MQQISEGIEASGSVAHSAGLSLQEYAAMVGLAIEQTGQSGSTIGNAYKTIFSRITKASTGEGTLAEDISKAEGALRGVGVEVRTSAHEFRNLSDIMADIGKIWDTLEDDQKKHIGYELAGTRQLNVLNSLFGSWDKYEEIIGKADSRAGLAAKNQAEYAETLAGKLGDIAATTSQIWSNVFDSESFKDLLDALNSILKLVNKASETFGGVGMFSIGIGAYSALKNVGMAK